MRNDERKMENALVPTNFFLSADVETDFTLLPTWAVTRAGRMTYLYQRVNSAARASTQLEGKGREAAFFDEK